MIFSRLFFKNFQTLSLKKFKILLATVFICILSVSVNSVSIESGIRVPKAIDKLFRNEVLDTKYTVEWVVDFINEEIEFTVTVETTGFVGFGISYHGGMDGADIFIGGVYPNSSTYFSDYHGVGNAQPVIDDKQSWELIEGSENGTHTVLKFKRLLNTCDSQDVVINEDTLKIIWSFGAADDILYHNANRGTLAVNFLDPLVENPDLSPYKKWQLAQPFEIPAIDTMYWCSFFKAPETKKHHVIGFDVFFGNEESKKHTHHVDVFKCTAPNGQTADEHFSKWLGYGYDCYFSNETFPVEDCQLFEYQWSIGGKVTMFPDDLGIPFAETESEYYMTEVHYDNPNRIENIKVHSGMEFYYTPEPRPVEAGFMQIGVWSSKAYALTIPPNSEDFIVSSHCPSECTSHLPSDGLNVFMYLLHSHLSGRKQRVRHFRGETELPWLANDDHYDFNYQNNRALRTEVKFLPGDQLTLECTYETKWKGSGNSTLGGRSPREEMCQAFLLYYPRFLPVNQCGSYIPQQKMLEYFGIHNVTTEQGILDPQVISPANLTGLKYSQVVENMNWTTEKHAEFQQRTRFQSQEVYCIPQHEEEYYDGTYGVMATYPPNIVEYIPVDVCTNEPVTDEPVTNTDKPVTDTVTDLTSSTGKSSAVKTIPFGYFTSLLAIFYICSCCRSSEHY